MKKQEKKFVLAALALLAITGLLALAGCKNDSVPEPTRYTVKFDKGDNSEYTGDLPADITVVSGTKLTAEQLEVLDSTDNYIFEGWYDGENKAEGSSSGLDKIAECYVRLLRGNFVPAAAADQVLFKKENYISKNGVYQYEDPNGCSSEWEYDKALYNAILQRIPAAAEYVEKQARALNGR